MNPRFPFEASLYASQSHVELDQRDRSAADAVLRAYPELNGWCQRCAWVAWASYCQSIHEAGWRTPKTAESRELEFLDYLALRQRFGPQAVLGMEDQITDGRAIWHLPARSSPTTKPLTH